MVESSLALLHTELEGDEAAVLQRDAEHVGIGLLQVGGRQVEDPLAIAKAENTVRIIGDDLFVYVVSRAPHRVYHRYRAVAARKHRSRIGDGLAIGTAHGELHRNCAALLEHAGSIAVDWLQDNAARCRSTAGAVRNVQRPVGERDRVVGRGQPARRDRVGPRKGSRRPRATEAQAPAQHAWCLAVDEAAVTDGEARVDEAVVDLVEGIHRGRSHDRVRRDRQ